MLQALQERDGEIIYNITILEDSAISFSTMIGLSTPRKKKKEKKKKKGGMSKSFCNNYYY
jgi:hypothetical protein